MNTGTLLDHLPLWGVFLATVAISFLSVEGGYRLGQYRRRRSEPEMDSPVGAMVGATLGLLAFILAFTFGLAASRFDARRQVVLEEANAIGTTYLRAGLLPEPQRSAIRRLLREYTDVRLRGTRPDQVEEANSRSGELHQRLWEQATAAAGKDPRPVPTGLFIQSLNDVIDLHAKRLMIGWRNRIPAVIWFTLYGVALLGMAALGYQEGLAGSKRSPAQVSLVVAFAGVLLLIADLDRPHEGALRVSQQPMIELRDTMKPSGN
jgi:hypothetical protein